MLNLNKLLIFFILIFLYSCSGDEKKEIIIEEQDLELQMIESYKAGVKALEEGDVLFAAKNFNNAELLFPQSKWASRSVLMAAYSYYSQSYYGDAIFEVQRFIKTYPLDPNIPYAHFLLAMCYFEKIIDEKKDLAPLVKSKKEFQFIIRNYPGTDFALDAKYKLNLIDSVLASKEIHIGKYYLEKQKWIAAINRFKNVIHDYDTTIFTEEALHRLVEVHYKIGLIEESKKYAELLGYNYLSSEWYKESYKVFNQDYENPVEKIKKKKRNFIIKKFKSLF
jgi:outer membrane protein assembly factor BamD